MTRKIAYRAMLAFSWALGSVGAAHAQSAQETVEQLNGEAMEAYHMMDVERAAELLERAIETATQGPVTPEALAITHRNLGVVYIGALGDTEGGTEQLLYGLCTDPQVDLDPLTSTPQIKEAFALAQQGLREGGCPPGSAGAQGGGGAAPPQANLDVPADDSDYAEYGEVEQRFDDETPWDNIERKDKGPVPRFFFQLGLSIGMSYVTHGMPADRKPPDNRVFVENGAYVPDPIQRFITYNQLRNTENPIPQPAMLLPDDNNNAGLLTDWVPDADSEDYYLLPDGQPQPYQGVCPADGAPTGPAIADIRTGENLLPSSYCVRVKSPGFVVTPALRANFGYFVSKRFSLAAITRLQFSAGQGSFANLLLGARGEFMILPPVIKGPMLSAFFGATFGQIQATVSTEDDGPWVKTGPIGAHVGVTFRYRFHRLVGAFISPELDVLFPDTLTHVDIPFGVELAF